MKQGIAMLAVALRKEIRRQKKAADTFGLTETGRARYLQALHRFELATEADIAMYDQYQVDISESLEGRLANVKDLPRAIRDEIADARDAGWLDTWMTEAEGDEESHLSPVFQPFPANSGWLN